MCEIGSDSVDFDVLGWLSVHSLTRLGIRTIVDIDKLLVDEGSDCSGVIEIWIKLARLVSNLISAKSHWVTNLSEQSSSSSTPMIDVDIMVFSINWLFNEGFLDDNAVDNNSVSIRS